MGRLIDAVGAGLDARRGRPQLKAAKGHAAERGNRPGLAEDMKKGGDIPPFFMHLLAKSYLPPRIGFPSFVFSCMLSIINGIHGNSLVNPKSLIIAKKFSSGSIKY